MWSCATKSRVRRVNTQTTVARADSYLALLTWEFGLRFMASTCLSVRAPTTTPLAYMSFQCAIWFPCTEHGPRSHNRLLETCCNLVVALDTRLVRAKSQVCSQAHLHNKVAEPANATTTPTKVRGRTPCLLSH